MDSAKRQRLLAVSAVVGAWLVFFVFMELGRGGRSTSLMPLLRLGEWWALAVLVFAACIARRSFNEPALFLSDGLVSLIAAASAAFALFHDQSLLNARTWIVTGLVVVLWAGWWLSRLLTVKELVRITAISGGLLFIFWVGAFSDRIIKMVAFYYALSDWDFAAFAIHPRNLGVPFGLLLPLLFIEAMQPRVERVLRWMAGVALVLMTALVVVSQGRAALFAVVIGLGVASCVYCRQREMLRRVWRNFVLMLVVATLVYLTATYIIWPDYFAVQAGFENRHTNMVSDSGRLVLWRIGWDQWRSGNMWLGAGFYGFDCTHALNATLHNLYLQVLVEFGLIGLVGMLLLMAMGGRLLLRSVALQMDERSFSVLWSVVALGAFTFVEGGYGFPYGQWVSLWLVIIVLALARERAVLGDAILVRGRYWPMIFPALGAGLIIWFMLGMYLSWQSNLDWVNNAPLGGFRPRLWLDDCGGH